MEKSKKYEVIEESRFLSNNEQQSIHGGACLTPNMFINCGPNADKYDLCTPTFNVCNTNKNTCGYQYWHNCVNDKLSCAEEKYRNR